MAHSSIEDVAGALGLPESALRLYLAAVTKKDPYSVSITSDQVEEVRNEIAERQKGMRLDDLAKAALSIEWLAKSAETNAHDIRSAADCIAKLDDSISQIQAKADKVDQQNVLESRLEKLDQQIGKLSQGDGAKALSMVAQVQEMNERQGRDIDKLRAEITALGHSIEGMRHELEKVAGSTERLVAALRQALQMEPISTRKEGESPEKKAIKPSEPAKEVSQRVEPVPAKEESEPAEETKKSFENAVPEKAAKFGVKREIEFNFLYERMGYQRPDQYPHGFSGEIRGPSDDEIKQFLATYELGCSVEEVDMLIVHRGEYQMVQYQRVESGGGFKNWIPSKRR